MSKQRKNNHSSEFYSVVQFKENDLKLFEAIPDGWFVNNDKIACYWPPKGRSFKLRALGKEKPDSSWTVTPCIFVNGGYVTYNAAFHAAKEKIDDFNTSSADDHLDTLNFRRQHPVLALSATNSFENIFSMKNSKNLGRDASHSVQDERKSLALTHKKSTDLKQIALKRTPKQINASTKPSTNQSAKPFTKAMATDGAAKTKYVVANPVKPDSCHLRRFDHESVVNLPRRSRSRSRHKSRSTESLISYSGSIHGPVRVRSSSGSRQSSRCTDRSRHSISNSGSGRSDSRSFGSRHSTSNSGSGRSDSRSFGSRHSTSNSGSGRSDSQGSGSSRSKSDRSRSNSKSSWRSRSASSNSSSGDNSHLHRNSTENRFDSKYSNKKSDVQQIDPVSFDSLNRRITRMEVTLNKVFVMVGDIIKHSNKETRSRNENRSNPALIEKRIPNGFKEPDFPINTVKSLYVFNKMLKRKDIYSFMLEQEKEYCAPSKSSNNVVMTAYLKRFISLGVRREVALKDPKGQKDLILFRDFKRVYDFLIDVMKTGYLTYRKQIRSSEVKTALRTVWGRTNQMMEEENRRKYK